MAPRDKTPQSAEIHFEGDSLEALSALPSAVKQLKESDERTWYRAIYLSRVGNVIYVLHCFEKDSRKTYRRDIGIARQRFKMVKRRVQEQRAHEERSGKQTDSRR